jgi:shikimate kinase
MKRLISLCGLAGAGKSTIAKALVEHHGFVRVAFADPHSAIKAEMAL